MFPRERGICWHRGVRRGGPGSPMLARSASQLPEGDQWSYEVKWDGYRTLAVKVRSSRSTSRPAVPSDPPSSNGAHESRELAACPATAASRASALERELLPAPGRLHRDRVDVFQGQVVVTFHCVGRAGWHASRVALACAWPIRGRIRRRRNERTPSATSLTETGLTRSA